MTTTTRLWQLSEVIEELETAITAIADDENLSVAASNKKPSDQQ